MLETTHVSRTLSRIPSLYLIPSPLHFYSPFSSTANCVIPPSPSHPHPRSLPGTPPRDLPRHRARPRGPVGRRLPGRREWRVLCRHGEACGREMQQSTPWVSDQDGGIPWRRRAGDPIDGAYHSPEGQASGEKQRRGRGHRGGALPIHPRFTPCSLSHASTPPPPHTLTLLHPPLPPFAHPRPPSTLCRSVRASPRPHGASCTVTMTSRGLDPSSTGAP
jgi:hypothetical protein